MTSIIHSPKIEIRAVHIHNDGETRFLSAKIHELECEKEKLKRELEISRGNLKFAHTVTKDLLRNNDARWAPAMEFAREIKALETAGTHGKVPEALRQLMELVLEGRVQLPAVTKEK